MMSEIRYDDDDEEEEDGDDDDEGNHDSLHFPFPFSKIDAAVLYLPLRPWRWLSKYDISGCAATLCSCNREIDG